MKKVALITGSSSGIGKDLALSLAKEYHVFSGVRKSSDFEFFAAKESITPLYLDVTKPDQIASALQTITSSAGKLDLLINNAGIASGGPLESSDMSQWRNIFDVNLFGVVETTKTFLPLLRASQGRIINISSISGLVASPFLSAYAASKFALEAVSDSLRRELHGTGVEVVLIEPGSVDTRIWGAAIAESEKSFEDLAEETKSVYGDKIKAFQAVLQSSLKSAISPALVTRNVRSAVFAKEPKTRYIVSPQKSAIRLLRILPDGLADKLVLKAR